LHTSFFFHHQREEGKGRKVGNVVGHVFLWFGPKWFNGNDAFLLNQFHRLLSNAAPGQSHPFEAICIPPVFLFIL
jgi:hypothetical protein